MDPLKDLFEKNHDWATRTVAADPTFFRSLAAQQSPRYLWIGCADSRVPANEIVGLRPGELFVHRNVANLVIQTDLNCLSVLQYAVDVLRVEHVIVCGHYGCGGVRAAIEKSRLGLIDNWLRVLRDTADKHSALLDVAPNRVDRLCELNVIEQARNVGRTTVLQDAWARQQPVGIHAWIYGLHDGLLRDLKFLASSAQNLDNAYGEAVSALGRAAPTR